MVMHPIHVIRLSRLHSIASDAEFGPENWQRGPSDGYSLDNEHFLTGL